MARTNKIIKVPVKKFSIGLLYDLFIEYLTTAPNAWTLMRKQAWPYGAVLKCKNWKNGEYGYVGLMYDEVRKGSSYMRWLSTRDVFRKEVFHHKDGLNTPRDYDPEATTYSGSVVTYRTPYGSYTVSVRAEAFNADADVMWFSAFKQYVPSFEWKELMGNDNRVNPQTDKGIIYNSGTNKNGFWSPTAVYPGTGCPAIGEAPSYYKNNGCDGEFVYLYFTKNEHNAALALNFRDYWDMAEVGFFEPFASNYEFAFPVMALSSNSGIYTNAVFFSLNGEDPWVKEYRIFDYTHNNKTFGHSMPCCAASAWDGTIDFINNSGCSQVQAMLPDGRWRSFANFGFKEEIYSSRGGFLTGHAEPTRVNTKYFITPYASDTNDATYILPSKKILSGHFEQTNNISTLITAQNRSEYVLLPISLVMNETPNDVQNMLGVIPDLYWCANPVKRYGLYEKDDELFLILPNCWEKRRWYLPNYHRSLLGYTQTAANVEAEEERLRRLSEGTNIVMGLGENTGITTYTGGE